MVSKLEPSRMIFGSGLSSNKDYEGFLSVARVAIENGCRSFDTAPSYKTEVILGQVIKVCAIEYNLDRADFFVQTKIDAWQMQEANGEVEKYVFSALKKMNLDYLDSILIHWPIPEYLNKTWQSFQNLKNKGVVKNIGICNLRMRHLLNLFSSGILPDCIQIERHPLMTFDKEVQFCKENGVSIQAYSPLCKMHQRLKESTVLKRLSENYGKSVGQIILRWHLDTGVCPVFTSSKPNRVAEYLNIFDFSLTFEDITSITRMNENYKLCLESIACPGF